MLRSLHVFIHLYLRGLFVVGVSFRLLRILPRRQQGTGSISRLVEWTGKVPEAAVCPVSVYLPVVADVDIELGKDEGQALITWITETMDQSAEESGRRAEVDLEGSEPGRDGPDMAEGEAGEVASPAEGQWDGADVGKTRVTAVCTHLVGLVGVDPDAVVTVGALRFTEDVWKLDLRRSTQNGDIRLK